MNTARRPARSVLGLLVSSLALVACAGSEAPDAPWSASGGISPLGDTTSDDATNSTSAVATEDGSSSVADDDAPLASTSDGVDTETTGDDTGGGPVGVVCSPNPTDRPCTACSKTYCCAQLEACWGDTDCSCFMMCAATNPDVFACGTQCSVDLFAPGPVADVVNCSGASCTGTCP